MRFRVALALVILPLMVVGLVSAAHAIAIGVPYDNLDLLSDGIPGSAFSIFGTRWGGGALGGPAALSFSVMPRGSRMEPGEGRATAFSALCLLCDELAIVHDAFSVWAEVTNLTDLGTVPDNGAVFNARPADPRGLLGPFGDIRLAASDIPQSGVLAHAYYPPPNGRSASGDIHFDNRFRWADDPTDTTADSDFDFFTVALHELGHSLGLGHSNEPASIMYPYYLGARRTLHDYDILGIQAIYGEYASQVVPEPASLLLLALALAALAAYRLGRRRPAE